MEPDEIKDEEVKKEVEVETTPAEKTVTAPEEKPEEKPVVEKKTKSSKKKKEVGQFEGYTDANGNEISPKRARNMRLDLRNK